MKTWCLALVVVCGGWLSPRLAGALTNESWFVELRDGSRLVGTPLVETLPIEFQSKTVNVELAMITDWQTSGAAAMVLRFRNGDELTSPLKFEEFPLRTVFGEVKLPVAQIVRCVARGGRSRHGLVRHLITAERLADLPPEGVEHDPARGVTFLFTEQRPFLKFPAEGLPTGNAARSVAGWIKTAERHRRQTIFLWGAKKPGDGCYLILFEDGHPLARRLAMGNWGGGPTEQAGNAIVNDGQWHHIVLTHDEAGKLCTYVDGKLDHQMQRSFATSPGADATLSTDEPNHQFIGSLADFRFYNRALTPDEIRDLGDAGK